MERTAVDSSEIRSIGYDAKKRVLEVEFCAGGVYRYCGVPEEVHRQLLAADSVGRFFNAEVRTRYRFRRLTAA